MNLEVEFFAGSESTKNQPELELEHLGRSSDAHRFIALIYGS